MNTVVETVESFKLEME